MGLAFRGQEESKDSKNRGNFIELLKLLANNNLEINKVVLDNAPKNLQMTSPKIQKDIVHACSKVTLNVIMKDLGDGLFGILVDESRDISVKEQMSIVIRYVDKKGLVIEWFLGIIHVPDTTTLTLKTTIDFLLFENGLHVSRIRGQGYDGASNIQGGFNGLKTLILNENSSAFSIHCFAHQLQLTLVAMASKQGDIVSFFSLVSRLLNIVGASCRRRDILRAKWANEVKENIYTDTLEYIDEEGIETEQRGEARIMKKLIESFEFVFPLHIMLSLLGITNDLSLTLQQKDQDITNAMDLVQTTRIRLQIMRDKGWECLMNDVSSFCVEHDISISNMDDIFVLEENSKRKAPKITNLHR